jgi:DNA-binding transcriptional LysR family regulator
LLLRCHGRRHARAGLAYLPDDDVQPYLSDGRVVRVLSDWCPSYPGDHLYYPSRRQPTSAVSLR